MTSSVVTDFTAFNCNLDTAGLIASLKNPSPFNLVRHSFMHDLAREGDVLSAEILYETGNALDLPNDEGKRPLHEAAFFGHMEMVKFLIGNGALLDAPIHPFGHTALYLAVQQSRYQVVQYLLKCGARIDIQDSLLGTGLLHVAATKDDMKMAGILIASGIDAFREDKKGRTARDIAAQSGFSSIAKALLKVMEHHAKYAV